jgi:hypothetical protein
LLDLLSGQVYKPEKEQFSCGWWKIKTLSPTGHPLVITYAALLKSDSVNAGQ